MKNGITAIFLAFTGLPASAQDIIFSPDATNACMQAATNMHDRSACIGTSADLCMEQTDGGMTTVGMSSCLWAEYTYWDGRLNQVYKTAMTNAVQNDTEMAAIGATVPSVSDALKTMQRAWIPFRDAACAYEVSQWGGGTGGGPARAACLMRQTAQQTLLITLEVQ